MYPPEQLVNLSKDFAMQPKSNGAIRSNTKAMPVKMLDPDLEDVTDGVLESFDLSAFNPTFTSTRAGNLVNKENNIKYIRALS